MVIISQPMIGRGIWKGEAELWGERHRIIVEILSDAETPWDIFEAWRASLGGVPAGKDVPSMTWVKSLTRLMTRPPGLPETSVDDPRRIIVLESVKL